MLTGVSRHKVRINLTYRGPTRILAFLLRPILCGIESEVDIELAVLRAKQAKLESSIEGLCEH